jgi:hypothetical protein
MVRVSNADGRRCIAAVQAHQQGVLRVGDVAGDTMLTQIVMDHKSYHGA